MFGYGFILILNFLASLTEGHYLTRNQNLDTDFSFWNTFTLDLQELDHEDNILALLGSRPFNNFILNMDHVEEVRTGHLSITNNLDILREKLLESIRRSRRARVVSQLKNVGNMIHFLCRALIGTL